jgi:transcriptional regulator with XRE-family HTH domain
LVKHPELEEGLTPQEIEALGEMVQRLREIKGISRTDLADRTGLSENYLWALETGTKDSPSVGTVTALAHALGFRLQLIAHVKDGGKRWLPNDTEALGDVFRQLRKERGWSEAKLAEVSVTSRTSVRNVETGNPSATWGKAQDMAKAMEYRLRVTEPANDLKAQLDMYMQDRGEDLPPALLDYLQLGLAEGRPRSPNEVEIALHTQFRDPGIRPDIWTRTFGEWAELFNRLDRYLFNKLDHPERRD